MDQPYIDALVNQALGAYKAGGDEGLKRWKQALPAPHLVEFERDCAERLQEAIEALDRGKTFPVDQEEWTAPELLNKHLAPPAKDPRKKHTRDRRRTKPL